MYQVRPPGHHAGVKQAMGFCLHNNAAVAASAAQMAGAKRVLIVDWVTRGTPCASCYAALVAFIALFAFIHTAGTIKKPLCLSYAKCKSFIL